VEENTKTDAMINRLEREIAERDSFIQGTVANAQDTERDLTTSEQELVTESRKRIEVVDNYYSPRKVTVNLKSRINWVWTDGSADVHDVTLISAPKGFKKFQTEPGSAGYTYSKTLTKPGVYKFICTLHEEDNMRMTITVRH